MLVFRPEGPVIGGPFLAGVVAWTVFIECRADSECCLLDGEGRPGCLVRLLGAG